MNPTIEVQMLIRKPVTEVFQAFIDPSITAKFWFSSATGRLEQGTAVEWTWQKYQFTAQVEVLEVTTDKRIQIKWGKPKTTVDFIFEKVSENQTYLKIRNYDIPLQGAELISFIIDSTGGFTTVVDGAKAWLEQGIQLSLVEDKFPPFNA